FLRQRPHTRCFACGPSGLDPQVASLNPTQILKLALESRHTGLSLRIAFSEVHKDRDAPHAFGLLRPRRERPRCRAAEQRYERAPPHVEHAASLPTIRGGLAIMYQQMRPVRPISRAVSLPRGTGKSLASCGDHLNHSESF